MGDTNKRPADPVTDETRSRIKELHERGLSRNKIAAELGYTGATIGRHAKRMGLAFDRSQTAVAVAAQKMDLAARRTSLVEQMIVVAEQGLAEIATGRVEMAMITQAGKVVKTERNVDQTDRRNALVSGGIAVDKATKLLDRDTGTASAMSTLDLIEAGIGAAARGLMDGPQTTSAG